MCMYTLTPGVQLKPPEALIRILAIFSLETSQSHKIAIFDIYLFTNKN